MINYPLFNEKELSDIFQQCVKFRDRLFQLRKVDPGAVVGLYFDPIDGRVYDEGEYMIPGDIFLMHVTGYMTDTLISHSLQALNMGKRLWYHDFKSLTNL